MRFEREGRSLWYATADAPAPLGNVQPVHEIIVTAGVSPVDASNQVALYYRVNQEAIEMVAAEWLKTDHVSGAQYFRARFPVLRNGDSVEYAIVCRCAGRQVPSADELEQHWSSFRVVETGTTSLEASALLSTDVMAHRSMTEARLPSGIAPVLPTSRPPLTRDRVAPGSGPFVPPAPGGHMPPLGDGTCPVNGEPRQFVVRGNVWAQEQPVACARVQAFDKDLRSEQLLGETTTNAEGYYEIHYTSEQFRRAEKRSADVFFRVLSPEGIPFVLVEPKIVFNVGQDAAINIIVEPLPQLSAYERLVLELKPLLEDLSPADLTNNDVEFLVNEATRPNPDNPEVTINTRAPIEFLRASAILSRDTGLPMEAFYGFASRSPSLPTDWGHLLAIPPLPPEKHAEVVKAILAQLTKTPRDELRNALVWAIDSKIIPASLSGRINDIVHSLSRMGMEFVRATGALRDDTTREPLTNFTVRIQDLDSGAEPEELAIEITDNEGRFSFGYPRPAVGALRRLQIIVLDQTAKEIAHNDLSLKAEEPDVIDVPVAIPKPEEPPTHALSTLATTVDLRIPDELAKFLGDRGMRTLADIRSTGGLNKLGDLPVPQDHPAIQQLEAHADLSHISADVKFNASLIKNGYNSVATIADTPRSVFVSAMHKEVGDFKAAQLQVMAKAQSAFLNNVMAEVVTAKANGRTIPEGLERVADELPDNCSCSDCEAAVSPAAYLTDLLGYTLKHVQQEGGQSIDLAFLARSFHQPFGDLPTDCEAVDQQVRQVRICIEVLRSYLGKGPLADTALAKAEAQYRLDVYTMLLNKVGTSYEEIRLARSAPSADRKASAERLGISLALRRPDPATTAGDELDQLFLDPEATPPNSHELTEAALERLFGLADTTRDPLSEGMKLSDDPDPDKALISRWNLDGAVWSKNTDKDGKVYLVISQNNGLARVEVFRASSRQPLTLVASGDQKAANQPVRVTPRYGRGLSGTFVVVSNAASSTIEIAAIPKFLCWRLDNLRALWEQQDRQEDAYTPGRVSVELNALPPGLTTFPPLSGGNIEYLPFNRAMIFTGVMTPTDRTTLLGLSSNALYQTVVNRLFVESQRPPIIDPDVIGPDDFRTPTAKANAAAPDSAFDLWLQRRKFVDDQLSALTAITTTDPVRKVKTPDVAKLFATMSQPVDYRGTKLATWPATTQPADFDGLLKDLTGAKSDATISIVEAAKLRVRSELNLSTDMFTRLMALRDKAAIAKKDPRNDLLSEDETRELLSILVQAQKTVFWSSWRDEEKALETRSKEPLFSREFFWSSLREPKEGEWPPIVSTVHPLIDPDIFKIADLPEPTVGAVAAKLWTDRRKELDDLPVVLKTEREINGFESMLTLALGSPSPGRQWQQDLNQLKTELASTNPAVVDNAKTKITNELHLSEESFRRLVAIQAKDAKPKPEDKPTAAEYAGVYTSLSTARKSRHVYPVWVSGEQTAGLNTNYWLALKARLPKWRASFEVRQAWKQALEARSKDPIVDPDLIGFEDLRDPLAGKAFETLRNRNKWLADQRSDLVTKLGASPNVASFDAIVKAALGIDGQVLVSLREDYKKGQSIETRLEQLNLTNAAFTYLLRIRELLANAQPIIEHEWDAVYSILIQAVKRRRFAEWREHERVADIALSPDYFAIPQTTGITFPPPEPKKLDRWRASFSSRHDWQDLLQSRIDQESAVIAAMHQALSSVEESALPFLRDALVMAATIMGKNLEEKAKWVTERFLIDAKVSGCQKTTRIAQAIETLQGLLFGLRTGQFNPKVIELDEAVTSVSWDSTRRDLFARGPGNKLVHKWWEGSLFDGYWHDWESLGGEITSRPVAASRGPSRIDVFARLPDNTLGHIEFNNGRWGTWESLGGVLTSAPAAVAGPNERLDVFVRGEGDTLRWWSRDTIQAAKWAQVPSANAGFLRSEPTVSSWGTGRLDVFIWGSGRLFPSTPIRPGLWHRSFENGNWSATWEYLAGNIPSAPTSVSWGPNRIDLSVRGTNNALWNFWWDGGAWNGPADMGGVLISAPALSSRGPGTLDVFVIGTDHQVWTRAFPDPEQLLVDEWIDWEKVPDASVPSLTLHAEDFDEEWKWMGSYATWRAAMFVHMYPENVLHPNLRKKSTPAFQSLVKKLRTNRRLTPEQACALAQEYASYYEDVAKLVLDATCLATAVIRSGSECAPGILSSKELVFIFGRGGLSSRAYWSTFDPDDQTGYAQSFWDEIPGIGSVRQIVGAVPYEMSPTSRRIFVFIRTLEHKLQFATFDLETWIWSGLIDLALPQGDASSIEIVIAQRVDSRFPPQLAFRANGKIYFRRMNNMGIEWEGGEWVVDFLVNEKDANLADTQQLLAAFDFSGFLVLRINGTIQHRVPKSSLSLSGTLGVNYIGAVKWGLGKSSVSDWYVDSLADGTIHAANMTNFSPLPIILNQFPVEGLKKIAPNCGVGKYVVFAYERQKSNVVHYFRTRPVGLESEGSYLRYDELDQVAPDGRIKTARRRIAPRVLSFVKDQFSIPSKLDGQAFEIRRSNSILTLFAASDSATNRTFVEETHYFIPILIADALQRSGEYIAALDWYRTIYNYAAPLANRKIYYGLVQEESLNTLYDRAGDWLLDPLNPHQIASTRRNTYTRYTILSIVRCLLSFADAEFTRDTPESVPRARNLYETAMELITSPELDQTLGGCDELIGMLGIDLPLGFQQRRELLRLVTESLSAIADRSKVIDLLPRIRAVLVDTVDGTGQALESSFELARSLIEDAKSQQAAILNIASSVQRQGQITSPIEKSLLAIPDKARASQVVSLAAGIQFLHTVSSVSGISPTVLDAEKIDLPWLRDPPVKAMIRPLDIAIPRVPQSSHIPLIHFDFCIPPNPILSSLRLRGELNLHKIRTCRNIAGMKRQLDPYAAPTDTVSGLPFIGAAGQLVLPGTSAIRPTLYRYVTLVERAKQLVQLAAQIEAAMLSALEKRDAESYTLLKARQDLSVSQASVQLQNLRIKEANDGVTLATLQQARAQIQEEHYKKLLEAGPLESEKELIDAYDDAMDDLNSAATALAAVGGMQAAAGAIAMAVPGGQAKGAELLQQGANSIMGAISARAQAYSAKAAMLAAEAGFERRKQDWEIQQKLAQQDVAIGGQQVTIASDHVDVVKQEKVIAEIQSTNAKDTIEFLSNKFTDVNLYDWMGDVLEGVYSFFLQQATSIAKLAENQLAFERQETPPAYIQADYWNAPNEGGITDGKAPDRRGLTGSARLLQDIYQLDQYAFDTNKRKLQLIKLLPLSRLAPVEFQHFRETGVLTFATPMEMFDRDFPGHYLRLIKRVKTSVIALIPPTQGIHATLSTVGVSRVVIGPEVFQTVPIRRDPEFVALCSPMNSTGLFELEPPSDMLLPFEGNGVDSTWEFRMPKPSNLFDYRTIADVIITIEYTALNSFDYREQVIQTLKPTLSADRPFSFRNQFADQWYDLHNPEQTKTPMTVRFRTRREDFPPNLDAVKIQQVVMYFARADGKTFEIQVSQLRFMEQGSAGFVGGSATSIDGVISTRRGNAGSWTAMLGKSPVGEWELALPDVEEIRNRFKNEEVEDILLVITYSGRTPPWVN